MITVEEALEIVLRHAAALPVVTRPILETLGCTLAADILAREDLPSWANSAMDGYAVQSASTAGASRAAPVALDVVGQIGAGQVFDKTVGPGQALKIMTGAPVPEGADSIVMVEETDGAGSGKVAIFRPSSPGDHVRERGEEVHAGDVVVRAGKTIRPAEIGMFAALGFAKVPVHERPRVAVLPTGDELREPGEPLSPGMVRNSNSYVLQAAIAQLGAIPIDLGIGRDKPEELREKMRKGLGEAHVLITSGGVSMGEFDFVPEIMAELDGRIHFDRVSLQPGKPTTFATAGEKLIFGLPGNPVSTTVTFEIFVRPALRKLAGCARLHRPVIRAAFAGEFRKRPGRKTYVRCIVTGTPGSYKLVQTGTQSSGVLRSMAIANALAVVGEEVERLAPGQPVEAILLDFPEDAVIPEA